MSDHPLFTVGILLLAGFAFALVRGVMKYAGVRCGVTVCNAGDSIRKYLGLCMVPQAGVSIGLVFLIQASPIMTDLAGLPIDSIQKVVNLVLLSVFVNELIGPSISKYAILMALIPADREQEITEGIEQITGDLDKKNGAMVITLNASIYQGSMRMM